ncbi:HlyD family secretion protein [Nannocystaceae bacterium ST9]
MSSPFSHTLRSLEIDGKRGSRALAGLALVLLAAWVVWLVAARVGVTEVSERARVEVGAGGHELSAAVSGRVTGVRVAVGDPVHAGQVIVELDDRETLLALTQTRDQLDSLRVVIAQREREIAAEREAIEAVERTAGAAASEAKARVDRALAAARLAETEAADAEALREQEVGTDREVRRTQAEAEQARAETRELRSAGARERFELDRDSRDRLATIIRIEGEIAELELDRTSARGRIAALEAELEHHRVRAPIDGFVGDLAAIERGSWLERGEPVGTVIPQGELEVVAQFEPTAIGRVAIGQPALLRLTGFPWTQYGSVRATVTRVASEPRQGAIRVELHIDEVPAAIVLEHGLPGTLEIEVERISPAQLLLRAAGRKISGTGAGTGEA